MNMEQIRAGISDGQAEEMWVPSKQEWALKGLGVLINTNK